MMKIRTRGTTLLEVELDKREQIRIAETVIRTVYDIPAEAFIDKKNNLVFTWEESMGSHSSLEREIVRKATKEDVQAIAVIDKLRRVG